MSQHPDSLVQVFRPEYMQWRVRHGFPNLSSDAFSGFTPPPHHETYNNGVQVAIEHYTTVYLPEVFVAQHLLPAALGLRGRPAAPPGPTSLSLDSISLTNFLHSHGINMRHLGVVLRHIPDDRTFDDLCELILREMVARTLKNLIHERLRDRKLGDCTVAIPDEVYQFTAAEAYHALRSKYGGFELTERRQSRLGAIINFATTPSTTLVELKCPDDECAFRRHIEQIGAEPSIDLVMFPPLRSADSTITDLLSELSDRGAAVGERNPVLLPTMQLVLDAYRALYVRDGHGIVNQAVELVERMVDIAEEEPIGHCHIFEHCAEFMTSIRQFTSAARLYERLLLIEEDLLGSHRVSVAKSAAKLARVYQYLGQLDEADILLKRARYITRTSCFVDGILDFHQRPNINPLAEFDRYMDEAPAYHVVNPPPELDLLVPRELLLAEQDIPSEHTPFDYLLKRAWNLANEFMAGHPLEQATVAQAAGASALSTPGAVEPDHNMTSLPDGSSVTTTHEDNDPTAIIVFMMRAVTQCRAAIQAPGSQPVLLRELMHLYCQEIWHDTPIKLQMRAMLRIAELRDLPEPTVLEFIEYVSAGELDMLKLIKGSQLLIRAATAYSTRFPANGDPAGGVPSTASATSSFSKLGEQDRDAGVQGLVTYLLQLNQPRKSSTIPSGGRQKQPDTAANALSIRVAGPLQPGSEATSGLELRLGTTRDVTSATVTPQPVASFRSSVPRGQPAGARRGSSDSSGDELDEKH